MADHSITMLGRQAGLLEATQILANNMANASTPGYKSEGTIFAEHVVAAGERQPSLSIGHLVAHSTDFSAGAMRETGNTFDLAIDGDGFFKVNTPEGPRLTRAGAFLLNLEGVLVDPQGNPVADSGGGEIVFTPEATNITIARDGTISFSGPGTGSQQIGEVGVFQPIGEPQRAGTNYWEAEGDQAIEFPNIVQGFLEQSNVSPMDEFAQLVMVQRWFDAGQTLAEQEHDRLESLINAIRQQG